MRNDLVEHMDLPMSVASSEAFDISPYAPPPFPCSMNSREKWSLKHALRFRGGKRMKTATMVGMNYYIFRRRLVKHGLATEE